jgi:hypothetical protein
MPSAKRSEVSPGRGDLPKTLQRGPATRGSGNAREADRMEAKETRTREFMVAERRREAELEKQGYWF